MLYMSSKNRNNVFKSLQTEYYKKAKSNPKSKVDGLLNLY